MQESSKDNARWICVFMYSLVGSGFIVVSVVSNAASSNCRDKAFMWFSVYFMLGLFALECLELIDMILVWLAVKAICARCMNGSLAIVEASVSDNTSGLNSSY